MYKFLSCFFYKSKNYISLNLLSLLFWIFFIYFLIKQNINSYFIGYGLMLFIPIILSGIFFIWWTIEYTFGLKIKNKFILENKIYNIYTFGLKIKNKFILENKIYNIFFIIGFSIMLLYLSIFTITIFYVLFNSLFIK